MGIPGENGKDGLNGEPGVCGQICTPTNDPLPVGSTNKCGCDTHILTIHSQTTDIPRCPDKWRSLWIGLVG